MKSSALEPVQRIPEYLLLLLLVCVQQFRSFMAQYHHLLQRNQELLLHNRKEVKRSTMKQLFKSADSGTQSNNLGSPYPCSAAALEHSNQARHSKQRLLEQLQPQRFQDWDPDQDVETSCYEREWPTHFYSPDSRIHRPTGLGCIPESETPEPSVPCQHHLPSRPAEFRQVQPGSALADALGEFLLPPDPPGMENLYEEDGGSIPDASLFDRCSSASSDSSIDIAFVKCPKGPSVSHHTVAANVSTTRDVFGHSGNQRNGYSKLPKRGSASPDEAVMMRRNQHPPLQASQRKSKSLNGLQMDNAVSCLDVAPLSGLGSHAKLERQGSKGSKGCSTPSQKVHSPLGNRVDADKPSEDLHGLLNTVGFSKEDSGVQPWGDESKWRGEENIHVPFSERSRKQDKGGFRSSFKKLFKKK